MLRHCFWHSLKVPRWDGHSQKVSYPVNIHKSWMNPAQSCIAGSVDQTEARICPQFSFWRLKSASTTFKAWGVWNSISNIALIDSMHIAQMHMYHIHRLSKSLHKIVIKSQIVCQLCAKLVVCVMGILGILYVCMIYQPAFIRKEKKAQQMVMCIPPCPSDDCLLLYSDILINATQQWRGFCNNSPIFLSLQVVAVDQRAKRRWLEDGPGLGGLSPMFKDFR